MAIVFPIAYKTDTSGLKKAQSEFGQFAKGLKSTLGALGVGLGVAEVANQLRDAARAAVEDSKSQALLANALRNTVGANADQIASVEQSISQMQMQAAVADDAIRPAFSSLVTSTHDVAQATDLMGVALDLAAYKGVDLQTAADALAKAHQGVTKGLFQLMPELRNSANYMETLRANTAGAADAAASNDPFQQMTVVIGELQERIGYYLLPTLKDLAGYLSSNEFQGVVNDAVAPFDEMNMALGNLNGLIPGLKLNFSDLISTMVNSWKSTAWGQVLIQFNNLMDNIAILNGTKLSPNLQRGVDAQASRLTAAAQAWQASQKTSGGGGTDLHPLNPKPGQVYTYMNYADGQNQPAVWWTQTWTGKTWTKPVRMTYNTKSASGSKTSAANTQAADALAQRIQDIKDFKDTIATNLEDLIPTARVTSEMGEFQRQVVDGFDAVAQSMKDAFDNKLITAEALAVFQKYAAGEKAALETIAKARDVLSKKIDIAKQLTQSVRDFANITRSINTQSESVTESYTKVIDGVNVTISKTMEVAKATDVVAAYKAIIDKTKNFATNLKALKAAGLNGQLFAQIVSAGVDAGGETAAAIVAGGADTIASLNDLFGQLDDTATQITATSTDIMYQAGLDITNSFIDGLVAEDARLTAAAKSLAEKFNTAFKAALDIAAPSSGAAGGTGAQVAKPFIVGEVPGTPSAGTAVGTATTGTGGIPTVTIPTFVKDYFSISGLMSSGLGLSVGEAAKFLQVSQTMANTPFMNTTIADRAAGDWYVTVNAGLGTNGQDVATQIVSAIQQYKRTNGDFSL